PHGVVPEKADRARRQRRGIALPPEVPPHHQAGKGFERASRQPPGPAAAPPPPPLAADLEFCARAPTPKTATGPGPAAFDALQEKALLARGPQTPHQENRRRRVGGKDAGDGNRPAGAGLANEVLALGHTRGSEAPRIRATSSGVASSTPKRRA